MSASAQHPGDSECLCHVIPLQDFRDHTASTGCWCGPRPLPDAPSVYVHNALDGREMIERGERMIQ